MAPLSPASARAIARFRSYRPPPSVYTSLPVSRRAAVLLLLFPDRHGSLRVVLTLRSANLSSYAGQVSLPGGKADMIPRDKSDNPEESGYNNSAQSPTSSLQSQSSSEQNEASENTVCETPWQTARREASEEIGLPLPNAPQHRQLPPPYRVEHLCELPVHLALTEMGVRPCVALLHGGEDGTEKNTSPVADEDRKEAKESRSTSAEEHLIPRLGQGEVAAVFSAPFEKFLCYEFGEEDTKRVDKNTRTTSTTTGENVHTASASQNTQSTGASTSPGSNTQSASKRKSASRTSWYHGHWTFWQDSSWRLHDFRLPRHLAGAAFKAASPKEEARGPLFENESKRQLVSSEAEPFRIWGLTAAILVDAARTAYGRDPEFECTEAVGEEELVRRLVSIGRLQDDKKKGVITRQDLKKVGIKGKI